MVKETQKLSEPLDTDLGMTLMLDSFMEHLQKSHASCDAGMTSAKAQAVGK